MPLAATTTASRARCRLPLDEDSTDGSRAFATKLEESFALTPMTRDDAANAVRRGNRTGYIVLTKGFGAASERLFYGQSRQVEIGVDPARRAEAAMIEGLLMNTPHPTCRKCSPIRNPRLGWWTRH